MLSLLFTICMIWFVGKLFAFGLKASWGIMKLLCTVLSLRKDWFCRRMGSPRLRSSCRCNKKNLRDAF